MTQFLHTLRQLYHVRNVKCTYELFEKNYIVALLSTFYITVAGIKIKSLKSI